MANIYDQALDEVASQVKTLADAISTRMLPETTIPVARLDPDKGYEEQFQNLVTVAFTRRRESPGTFSNVTDTYGYPCHVIFALPSREDRHEVQGWVQELMEMVSSHFNNKRRMADVTGGTLHCQLPCTVAPGPEITTTRKVFYTLTVWAWFEHIRQA